MVSALLRRCPEPVLYSRSPVGRRLLGYHYCRSGVAVAKKFPPPSICRRLNSTAHAAEGDHASPDKRKLPAPATPKRPPLASLVTRLHIQKIKSCIRPAARPGDPEQTPHIEDYSSKFNELREASGRGKPLTSIITSHEEWHKLCVWKKKESLRMKKQCIMFQKSSKELRAKYHEIVEETEKKVKQALEAGRASQVMPNDVRTLRGTRMAWVDKEKEWTEYRADLLRNRVSWGQLRREWEAQQVEVASNGEKGDEKGGEKDGEEEIEKKKEGTKMQDERKEKQSEERMARTESKTERKIDLEREKDGEEDIEEKKEGAKSRKEKREIEKKKGGPKNRKERRAILREKQREKRKAKMESKAGREIDLGRKKDSEEEIEKTKERARRRAERRERRREKYKEKRMARMERKAKIKMDVEKEEKREKEQERGVLLMGVNQEDAFNYAARFLLYPLVSTGHDTEKTVTISLHQHQIKAVGINDDASIAYASANRWFMLKADEYLKRLGDSDEISSHFRALSTKNSTEFVAFAHKTLGLEAYIIIIPARSALESRGIKQTATPVLSKVELCSPISDFGTGDICRIANLVIAVEIQRNHPETLPLFLKGLANLTETPALHIHPVSLPLGQQCLASIHDSLSRTEEAGLPEITGDPGVDLAPVDQFRKRIRSPMDPEATLEQSKGLKSNLEKLMKMDRGKMKQLPIFSYRNEVLELINRHIFSIVTGSPLSCISTQIPQILLDDAIQHDEGPDCNVLIAQRSDSGAISRASEVAKERARTVGDTVGYHTMSICRAPLLKGSITYSTTEVLLLLLQHAPNEVLGNISHLIIDDLHERDLDTDLLLTVLKREMMARLETDESVPQVALMSSSPEIDTSLLGRYLEFESDYSGGQTKWPLLHIRDQDHVVKHHFLDDMVQTLKEKYTPHELEPFFADRRTQEFLSNEETFVAEEATKIREPENMCSMDSGDKIESNPRGDNWRVAFDEIAPPVPVGLVAFIIAHIAKTSNKGPILVFLPGHNNMRNVAEKLLHDRPLKVNFRDRSKYKILYFRDTVNPEISQTVPPGCRKIILCEDVDEASTAPLGVKHVVDVGLVNQPVYYPEQLWSKPSARWASKSTSDARAAHAGLVRNGHYYALFTETRYEALRKAAVPELRRTDLQTVCLRVKAAGLSDDVRRFLLSAPEPPLLSSVDAALSSLQSMGAMDNDGNLTPLGRLVSTLPIHPKRGKLIMLGIIFRCLEPILITDILLQPQSFFADGIGQLKMSGQKSGSDHIAEINTFRTFLGILRGEGNEAALDYCQKNSIRFSGFKQFLTSTQKTVGILSDNGLIPYQRDPFEITDDPFGGRGLNTNSSNVALVKAIIAGGLYPNTCVLNGPVWNRWQSKRHDILSISPDSANYNLQHSGVTLGSLMTFSRFIISNEGKLMYPTSRITPLMALLFGEKIQSEGRILHMDGWLPFNVEVEEGGHEDPETAAGILLKYKQLLDHFLSSAFQEMSIIDAKTRRSGKQKHRVIPRTYHASADPVREMFIAKLIDLLSHSESSTLPPLQSID
ncbi:uncharacterized protein BDCG_09319 [Blastomyces dermatitidis ER-3]|uniref:Helicase-associated domain-containing protein n=2 Tax=Blastomyces TaxID=229219 RepID=A0A179V3W7_BLAGS|nr:uncharacterized protein BDBG_09131 [Blastomyces gilchristii SLH14081]XP_045273666.1 uncharacterized protein BDCG_09319 [Blastomyces dermatitidis ER-3]EEQ86050.1 hypothetical protein BDCG_09319 [Blastomyces dermatitidis ER-3]OAT14041.1 hypothetical protein BDBG_09131 [Blastomyces gilchristii SLH14081]